IVITGDTQKTITLHQPVTLRGHVYDSLGNLLPNQTITLFATDNSTLSTTTDNSGYYSVQVASGNYTLDLSANNNPLSLNVPQAYDISTDSFTHTYSLTQDTTLDITIPVKKVTVHVQDSSVNPLENAGINIPSLN